MQSANPKTTCFVRRNHYTGRDGVRGEGFNVSGLGVGLLIMGIPEKWARRAVDLLNECVDGDAQNAELTRIRTAIQAAMDANA